MSVDVLFYFANLGVFCGCIAMILSYILAQTMCVMQDKPDAKSFKFHARNTPLCGGISIFIAYVAVVLGGIKMTYISPMDQVPNLNIIDFYEYAGLHLYATCLVVLCSGAIKDIYGRTILWIMFCIQICGFCMLHLLFYLLNINYAHNLMLLSIPCYIALFLATNGVNTIDGIHGNATIYGITVLFAICYISYQTQSNFVGFASSLLIGILFVFLLFNYPLGRMFLGDSGAFLLGFCIGALLLLCVLHYGINVWYCSALLLYPACALLSSLTVQARHIRWHNKFSFLEILWQRHDIHLHYMVKEYCGNAAALVINAYFSCFIVFITYYHEKTLMILIASVCFCVFYIVCFAVFWKKKANLYNKA